MSASAPPLASEPRAGPRARDRRPLLPGLLWRHRSFLAACAVVGLLLGLVVALVQTPEYRAGGDAADRAADADLHDRDRRARRRRRLLAEHGLLQHAVQDPALEGPRREGGREAEARRPRALQVEQRPGDALHGRRSASSPMPESRLVLVAVTHRDPREAALWANTLADVYIEQTLAQRVEAARKAYEWLQDRLAATQKGMRESPRRSSRELPAAGPLRARGQRLGGLDLDREAQRGLHPGPGAAHRDRGRAQAGGRDAEARARSSTRCRRWPRTAS